MSKMLVSESSWPGDTEKCPADYDYLTYLEANEVTGKSLFHMGSGGHHVIGKAGAEHDNSVIAVTNSRQEMTLYAELIEQYPDISFWYKLWYCDVHMLDVRQLPRFDYVSLFHLGEMSAPAPYSKHGIAGVVSLFSGKMTWNGRFVFYRRSAAWDRVEPVIDQLLHGGWEADQFASLIVLRRNA